MPLRMRVWALSLLSTIALACNSPAPPSQKSFYANTFEKTPTVDAMTALGRSLFFAPELSASGSLSCASCHDPARAFTPNNDLSVQLGGADGRTAGLRAVPSLRYLQNLPPFNEHYQDSDGDGSDQGPAGGYTWDGRAQSAHDQARAPLFSPFEMANANPEQLIARITQSRLAPSLRATFGEHALDRTDSALKAILMSLEVFQQSPKEFYPYDSKYDAFLRGQTKLDEREARGLAVFNDPAKGNCASCHPSQIKDGNFPPFTDFGFVALGAPRNPAIPANADPSHFDLGLCGPLRTDFAGRDEYCGLFRTPTLRNVTLKRRWFHNGVFKSLKEVLHFYSQRGAAFDDLPARAKKNVNREPPFNSRRAALTDGEIADLLAFLGTLQDGFTR